MCIKFIIGLFPSLCTEIKMFNYDNATQSFNKVLIYDYKLGKHPMLSPRSTHPRSPPLFYIASLPVPMTSSPISLKPSYFSFHKYNTHSSEECHVLRHQAPPKILFSE
jgi:hypothetical protein